MWFVSLPVQVATVTLRGDGVLTWLGVRSGRSGSLFETVGDAAADGVPQEPKAPRPTARDSGLWALDATPELLRRRLRVVGPLSASPDSWPGALTVLSPVAIAFFLVQATGAKLLEKTMMQRDGYPQYAARTPMFLPRPPRRATS